MINRNDIILVDLFDRPVGTAKKYDAHTSALLHRAFSVFLIDGDRMLLQRRAKGKYHSGGMWANSCCSHPSIGEETEEAAHRRLEEELGMDCPLKEIGSFVYYHQFGPHLHEYEYDHIFVGKYGGDFSPAPTEIAELRWVSLDQLAKELLKWPERFAVWFLTAAPYVLKWLKENESAQGGRGD